jgi:uncharacterized membrane protein
MFCWAKRMTGRAHTISRWLLTVFMVGAGVNHFVSPDHYVAMMPAMLPEPLLLVQISGVAEILGGLGLILPATRRIAAWGLIALLVAVFPANLNMAINHLPVGPYRVPSWALWARLPLQVLLIWWVSSFTRRARRGFTAYASSANPRRAPAPDRRRSGA